MSHASAKTTPAIREEIQRSSSSHAELAAKYGVNRKTVAKWKRRTFVDDVAMGPKNPCSTVLTPEDEAFLVAFRRMTLLPLDDCLYAMKMILPHLSRSSLHRCYRRHGVSRLPQEPRETTGEKPPRRDELGHFRIAVAEFRTDEGPVFQFLAIDRASRYAVARLAREATASAAVAFLGDVIDAVPYPLRSILTAPYEPFASFHDGVAKTSAGPFGEACLAAGVQHRLARTHHLWPPAQTGRATPAASEVIVTKFKNRQTYADATMAFVDRCNFSIRFKNLRGLTPHEFMRRNM